MNFITNYFDITFLLDELLKNDVEIEWSIDYSESFEFLKKKLVKYPILIFMGWTRKFHVHVNASNIEVGIILAYLGDDNINHPNCYANKNSNEA